MEFKEENMREEWKLGKDKQDDYGLAVYRFSENWANLMEKRMAEGEKLEDIAKQSSSDADDEGITGFMYGVSISLLSNYWKYGEALRRWHNVNIQIHNEGEKANESGGVLNPALLIIQ